ncbi:MAG: spermidine/putrescine transport system permease protein [Micromonosporaceae bacterium]
MTVTADRPASVGEPEAPVRKVRGRLGDRLLYAYTWLIIVWLLLPIGVMILFGFNNPKGRYNQTWQGFTLKWYRHLFDISDLTSALGRSLVMAVVSTVVSTALGTFIGLALGKYRFRGQGTANLIMFATISSPEIIMGASLLTFFVTVGVSFGFLTVLIAHVMFSLSFVAVVIRSRVLTLDPFVEEAARDLGAGAWATFRLVTLPMIFPGVMAGALLAFALSIDDFVVTYFNSGQYTTFPLWIWGVTRVGIPPQVNVMGTLIFVGGVLLAVTNALFARRRQQ